MRLIHSYRARLAGRALPGIRASTQHYLCVGGRDLGYGDLGVFGQKHFETPHLDRLTAEGMRFNQHYAGSTVCDPSRDALLSGVTFIRGHTFIRGNKPVQPEGQHPIPSENITVAELFRDRGYRTGAVGKWGLGAPDTEGVPNRQGCDFFYGYNCQREAHSYYPEHVWRNEDRVVLEENLNGERGVYSHDLMTAEALDFIRASRDGPFFSSSRTRFPTRRSTYRSIRWSPSSGGFPKRRFRAGTHAWAASKRCVQGSSKIQRRHSSYTTSKAIPERPRMSQTSMPISWKRSPRF